jgi:hypothetical protein
MKRKTIRSHTRSLAGRSTKAQGAKAKTKIIGSAASKQNYFTFPPDEWLEKFEKETRRHVTPRKLRAYAPGLFDWLREGLMEWFALTPNDRGYFALTFWRDLRLKGVDFPPIAAAFLYWLWLGKSDYFRALADYIDALRAPNGDRGQRFLVTENLLDYKWDVELGRAKRLNWLQLKERFWPTYSDSNANWQKFLRERQIPFDPVGEFRRRGARKRVSKKR